MANDEMHIELVSMDKYTMAHLADATIDLVKRFKAQPGGREILEEKMAELRAQHFI